MQTRFYPKTNFSFLVAILTHFQSLLSNNCQSKSHNGAIQRKRIFPLEAELLISNFFKLKEREKES